MIETQLKIQAKKFFDAINLGSREIHTFSRKTV